MTKTIFVEVAVSLMILYTLSWMNGTGTIEKLLLFFVTHNMHHSLYELHPLDYLISDDRYPNILISITLKIYIYLKNRRRAVNVQLR